MISVGIDVSKGKNTVCMLKPYGELASMILRFDDEVKVVMEATGIYHLPVLTYLREKGIFVSVINPYKMKVYRSEDLRRVKTDKLKVRCCCWDTGIIPIFVVK